MFIWGVALRWITSDIPETLLITISLPIGINWWFFLVPLNFGEFSKQGWRNWNNSQATIHPFVIYYIDPEKNELSNKCYACISDHKTHDTIAVFCFLQKLLTNHIIPEFQHIQKVFYFSDGSGAQYKNYKNLTNLLFHEEDFGLKAEWHFFGTSHGKNACDGVGGY